MQLLKSQKILLFFIMSIMLAGAAWATPISDNYIGAADPKHRDVIGNQDRFDIDGADVKRVGDDLVIVIYTNFAGLADNGLYAGYTTDNMGIGYGDLFLAPSWNPRGPSPYLDDDHSTGTTWSHAFSLDDRWSDAGGDGYLFELDSSKKASQILLSENFITGASYRVGQEIAVDPAAGSPAPAGSWTLGDSDLDSDSDPDYLQFIIDISGAEILKKSDMIAFHWTMTCGNDVIEGQAPNSVPEPSSVLLLGLGIIGVAGMGRCRLREKI